MKTRWRSTWSGPWGRRGRSPPRPTRAGCWLRSGRVLAAGGEVTIRLGNHDAELALGEVQEALRESLGQPAAVAARLRFERGDQPHLIEVGGTRVLVTHGEHGDAWNRVDYARLPGPGGPDVAAADYAYAPGSQLVKTIMNPLKRVYKMRFADLLKPDFQGAVMTALAVNPSAVRAVAQISTARLLWSLATRSFGAVTFDAPGEDLGLGAAIASAGLTPEESEALGHSLDPETPLSFGGPDEAASGPLGSAQVKLARAGLRLYSRFHRSVAGDAGDRFFDLAPADEEWADAQRLARKFGASAVVFGHTHAARFRSEPDLAYLNTGTWIWLMQPPPATATDEDWHAFLRCCRDNPWLDAAAGATVPMMRRFTAALLEPGGGGGAPTLSLVRWSESGELESLGTHKLG